MVACHCPAGVRPRALISGNADQVWRYGPNFTLSGFSLPKAYQILDHRNPICRNFENLLFRPSWPNQIAID